MKQFPNLRKWFDVSGYYEHRKCKAFTLLLKDNLTDKDRQGFVNEFAKLLCRLRCNYELPFEDDEVDLCVKFQNAIDGTDTLKKEEKQFLVESIFFEGIISQKQFNKTGDYKKSIDEELFNGHFGEVLFYIIREQFLEDEKVMIEPNLPKPYSKEHGLDYVEIRKNHQNDEYYFIIGEVKTTNNTIGNYPDEIIASLTIRPQHLFVTQVNAFKERARYAEDDKLKLFINRMPIYFLKKSPQKKFAGVIHYGSNNKHQQSVFKNFYSDCNEHLDSQTDCRRIKLIGIKDIQNLKKRVLDCIWKTLLT